MKSALFTLFPVAVVLLMSSCQPAVHMQVQAYQEPLEPFENVMVTKNAGDVPAKAVKIGEVSVTDAGMTTKCSYEYVIEHAKAKARESGGDIVLIVKHETPDLWSSCHRIWGHVYRSPDGYEVAESRENNAGMQQSASPDQKPESSAGAVEEADGHQKDREEKSDETSPADSRGSGTNPGYFGERITSRNTRPSQTAQSNTQGATSTANQNTVVLPERKEPAVMISAFGGFGRRLSPLPDNLSADAENFMDKMKSGGVYGFDLSFRVAPSNYIGFYFNRFRSSDELFGGVSSGNNTVVGTWEENIGIDFIGLSWLTTFKPTPSGSYFYLSAMLGYTSYLNTGVAPFESDTGELAFLPFDISGNTFGYRLEGGGHIALGDNIFIKLGLGFGTGVVTSFDVEIGNERTTIKVDSPNEGEGLVRVDLVGGLVIAF